jgi:hypothetical protein
VELSSPGLGIGLAFRIRHVPRETSPGLPWPPVLIAHTSSLGCGSASHHAAPYPELPCLDPGIGARPTKVASRGPIHPRGL